MEPSQFNDCMLSPRLFCLFALVCPEPTTAPNWLVQIRAPHPSFCPRWCVLRDHDAFPGQDLGKVPISQLAEAKARYRFHATQRLKCFATTTTPGMIFTYFFPAGGVVHFSLLPAQRPEISEVSGRTWQAFCDRKALAGMVVFGGQGRSHPSNPLGPQRGQE